MGKLTAIVFFAVAAVIVFGGCGFVAGDCAAREAAFSSECGALPGIPYRATPLDAQILYESGEFALFAGETVSDTEHNDAEGNVHEESSQLLRNSLFLRRTLDNGKYEWRLLLTTGGDWRDAEPSDTWALSHSANLRCQFLIYGACISSDGRYIWMICNSQGVEYFTFTTICRWRHRGGKELRFLSPKNAQDHPPCIDESKMGKFPQKGYWPRGADYGII